MTYRDDAIPTWRLCDVIPVVNYPSLHGAVRNRSWVAPVWSARGPAVVFCAGTPGTHTIADALLSAPRTVIGRLSPRERYVLKGRLLQAFPPVGRPPTHHFIGSVPYMFLAAALALEPALLGSVEQAFSGRYVAQMKAADERVTQYQVEKWKADALAELREKLSGARYRLNEMRGKAATGISSNR